MKGYTGRRFSIALVATILSLLPSICFSLGFGNIKLYSYLNEPLDAEIELVGAPDEVDLSQLTASLASQQDFRKIKLARPYFLTKLRFEVVKGAKQTYIQVKSDSPIQEPFLEFLVVLNWPEGRLVRGYTLLLDPLPLEGIPKKEARLSEALSKNPASSKAALLKSAQRESFSNPLQEASLEMLGVKSTDPVIAENLESLFDPDSGFKSDTSPAIQKMKGVSVSASKPAPTQTLKADLEEIRVSKPHWISLFSTVQFSEKMKSSLLLGSTLMLFMGLASGFWFFKRRSGEGLRILARIPTPAKPAPIFDNELMLKLDLARQYLGIQDTESAEEIVKEVLARGNLTEIEMANELLQKIRPSS